MPALPVFHPHPVSCRLCGRPLSPLARLRGDLCDAMDCRRRALEAERAAQRAADLAARQRVAVRAWGTPALAQAPVVWLQNYRPVLARLPAARRRAHEDYLLKLAASPPAQAAPPADAAPASAVAARVCGFCGGRCCTFGAASHAFIERVHLARWALDHPGGSLADAARDYAGRMPAVHMANSCVYHGRAGCTLPRAMRSDICNGFRCEALQAAEAQAGPEAGVVVAKAPYGRPAAERAAWVRGDASEPLLRRPRRRR